MKIINCICQILPIMMDALDLSIFFCWLNKFGLGIWFMRGNKTTLHQHSAVMERKMNCYPRDTNKSMEN